jgi:hypothetical protein
MDPQDPDRLLASESAEDPLSVFVLAEEKRRLEGKDDLLFCKCYRKIDASNKR